MSPEASPGADEQRTEHARPAPALTPEQRKNYYQTLRRAMSLRTIATRVLGDRIKYQTEAELLADCPRHASQSGRSLRIDLHKGLWYCFGCGVGGDGLQLVEFVDYGVVTKGTVGPSSPTHRAARDHLAEIVGLPKLSDAGLTDEEIVALEKRCAEAEEVFRGLTELTAIYHQRLMSDPAVLEWIERQWGFTKETVEKFKLGWADVPDAAATLQSQGFTEETLLATGAFRKDGFGKLWQFFQKRVVIPYFRAAFVAYLIGRKTPHTDDNDYEQAKYKKLPRHDAEKHPHVSTAIDNSVLFGEEILRDAPKRVVITEGVADCIAAQAAGFPAISPATVHIRRADFDRVVDSLRLVKTTFLVFDNELSGIGHYAAYDLARSLIVADVNCRIGELPLGPTQLQAREELARLLGAEELAQVLREPPASRAKQIAALIAKRSVDQTVIDKLISDAKVDVAEWFRQGGTAAAFEDVLRAARDVVTVQIDALDLGGTDELRNAAIASVLNDIARERPLEQEEHLRALKLKTGRTLQVLRGELRTVARNRKATEQASAATEQADRDHPYKATERGLVWVRETRDGPQDIRLCNFRPTIVAHVRNDDGEEQQSYYEIEATIAGAQMPALIPAASFAQMNWVGEHLGPRAILAAGMGVKDHARAAIQFLSPNPKTRTVYIHTGWTKLDGKWVYLHCDGAIGADGPVLGVEVQLPAKLGNFVLPDPPASDAIRELVRQSLQILDLAPESITFSLFGGVVRVVLDLVDFGQQLTGETGAFKTALAAVFQSFFGAGWNERSLPDNWGSTANAIEAVAFVMKDALFVLDDFAPSGGTNDVRRMHRDADRIFRNQGNRAGRGRLRPDSSLRPTKAPRGMIVSTGEDLPGGHSARARTLVHDLKKGDITATNLTTAQARAASGVYASTMSAYLKWLAPQLEQVRTNLRARALQLRDEQATEGQHRRTPTNIAQLRAGFEVFVEFSRDVDALSVEEADALLVRAQRALEAAASAQSQHLTDAESTNTFFRLLAAAVASGSAHIAANNGSAPSPHPEALGWILDKDHINWLPRGARVGWIDGPNLYLEFTGAVKAAQSMAGDTDRLGIAPRTLLKRLAEHKYLVTQDEAREKHLIRVTLQGARREVAHLRASTLLDSAASREETTPPPSTSSPQTNDAGLAGQEPPAAAATVTTQPLVPAVGATCSDLGNEDAPPPDEVLL